jgi:putative membrane protein (TIGR04086 family)
MDTYRRNNSRKQQLNIDLNTIIYFIPYWLLSILVVFILLVIASLLYMITPLTQNSLPAISRIIFVCAEVAIAYFVGRTSNGPGMISGGIFGLGFSLIVLLIGLFTAGLSIFSLKFILILLTGILFGAFGGIVGKNSSMHSSRRRGFYINK